MKRTGDKKSNIEIIARAIIVHDEKILLCKAKAKDNWFFPGGHVESGETVQEALGRELKEEIGVEMTSAGLIGLNENSFIFEDQKHQEVNIIFEVEIDSYDVASREDHLEFHWFDLDDLEEIIVLPEGMKKAVLKWIKNKNIFYYYQ